jgi:hypothetical protein
MQHKTHKDQTSTSLSCRSRALRPRKIEEACSSSLAIGLLADSARIAPVEHPLRIYMGQIQIRAAKPLATSLTVSLI